MTTLAEIQEEKLRYEAAVGKVIISWTSVEVAFIGILEALAGC